MFMAYFITFALIVICVGFAVAIINGIKGIDEQSINK